MNMKSSTEKKLSIVAVNLFSVGLSGVIAGILLKGDAGALLIIAGVAAGIVSAGIIGALEEAERVRQEQKKIRELNAEYRRLSRAL